MPFCASICEDCRYHVQKLGNYQEIVDYVDQTILEIESKSNPKRKIINAYFGGGTFNLIKPVDFERLLVAISNNNNLEKLKSITIEGSPNHFNESYTQALTNILETYIPKSCTIRFSVGGFGFDIGGRHESKPRNTAVEEIKTACPDSVVNVDIVIGHTNNNLQMQMQGIEASIRSGARQFTIYAMEGNLDIQSDPRQVIIERLLLEQCIKDEVEEQLGSEHEVKIVPNTAGGAWLMICKKGKNVTIDYLDEEGRWGNKTGHKPLIGIGANSYSVLDGDKDQKVRTTNPKLPNSPFATQLLN